MEEGYILSNKFRRAIFDELAAGEHDLQRMIKKQRLIPKAAQRVMEEFIAGGIVRKEGTRYTLTEEGERLVQTMGG
jgi:predicted transcriptional regulator